MPSREASSRVRLSFTATLANRLDYEESAVTSISQTLLSRPIKDGVDFRQANRMWADVSRNISSGSVEDIDIYDFFGIDVGAGAGKDGVGLALGIEEVVALIIKQTAGPGRLEVMPSMPVGGLTWAPKLTTANGGSLKQNGVAFLYQEQADAFDVVDGVNHVLRLRADSGSVTYDLFVLGRHDDDLSTSTTSSISSASTSTLTSSSTTMSSTSTMSTSTT